MADDRIVFAFGTGGPITVETTAGQVPLMCRADDEEALTVLRRHARRYHLDTDAHVELRTYRLESVEVIE